MTRKLGYSVDAATVLFHVFTSLVFLFPIFGAIVADSFFGKFRWNNEDFWILYKNSTQVKNLRDEDLVLMLFIFFQWIQFFPNLSIRHIKYISYQRFLTTVFDEFIRWTILSTVWKISILTNSTPKPNFFHFRTILYLSCVYALGSILISIGAIPILHLPAQTMTVIGLILIAGGSGGIKPCVAAFGGDQFKIPEQAKQLATFFSFFYFSINAGSLISTTLTPILREDVHCFGDMDCFSLAFGVPGALMIISIVAFVAGKSMYTMEEPKGNVIVDVSKCIVVGLKIRSFNLKAKIRRRIKTPLSF